MGCGTSRLGFSWLPFSPHLLVWKPRTPPALRPHPARPPQHEADEKTLSGYASLAVLEASMVEFYEEVMEERPWFPELTALVRTTLGSSYSQVCLCSIHSLLLALHPRIIQRNKPGVRDVICLRNWLTGLWGFKCRFGGAGYRLKTLKSRGCSWTPNIIWRQNHLPGDLSLP